MLQGQPDGAELLQSKSAGVKDAARDVDVRNGVAGQQDLPPFIVMSERQKRDRDGRKRQELHFPEANCPLAQTLSAFPPHRPVVSGNWHCTFSTDSNTQQSALISFSIQQIRGCFEV